jgi:hypothetical protein
VKQCYRFANQKGSTFPNHKNPIFILQVSEFPSIQFSNSIISLNFEFISKTFQLDFLSASSGTAAAALLGLVHVGDGTAGLQKQE